LHLRRARLLPPGQFRCCHHRVSQRPAAQIGAAAVAAVLGGVALAGAQCEASTSAPAHKIDGLTDGLSGAQKAAMADCCRLLRAQLNGSETSYMQHEDYLRSFYLSCVLWRKMPPEEVPKVLASHRPAPLGRRARCE